MITVNLQKPARASVVEYDAGEFHGPFSAVKIADKDGNTVTLFLPAASGAAVAAAINAAIGGEK
ncbi:hypothetical protein UFOVP681_47 [uncultured Caudovirales phage]|uniref:Uncharacterized protein n=1 Tax=uncultured Caudovirales phage TaxID=2100421 RepID=A0A6J5NDH9_9CAUD|nr:hypothetical protein UFOVP681_47 [uncultured Caudovirales phage]